MIPESAHALDLPSFELTVQPGCTYALDLENGRIRGTIDGIGAVEQAVHLILNVDRYQHMIYSWNYASELRRLIGKPMALVLPEVERLVTEALAQDDRIVGVGGFQFSVEGRRVHAAFTVHSVYGDFTTEKEVDV